jgi:aryl-alcohol dehydrogenase-like predicted oxidoreductase
MRTDVLDIVHLHSFPAETIRQNGLWDALQAMVSQGLVRVAGYSGENEDLTAAVDGGRVQAIECSVNVCDQRTIDDPLPRAKQKGYGVIAKRPLANAPWRHTTRPVGQYVEEYWHRWTTMHVDTPIPPDELFLRFAAYTWGVDSVVTGVSSLEHLQRNAQALEQSLLPRELYNDLRSRFRECDSGWRGQV